MQQRTAVVSNPVGLHARPAAAVVKAAQQFASAVSLSFEEKQANAKSLFSVLVLGARQGDTVTVTCEGADELAAAEAVTACIENNLDRV